MSDILPSWLDPDDWNDYVEHRKQMGKPLTEVAKKRTIMKLYRMKEAGEDISAVIEQTVVDKGWIGLFPVKRYDTKPQVHQDAHREELPEISDEERERNLEYLQSECAKVFNISGGRK